MQKISKKIFLLTFFLTLLSSISLTFAQVKLNDAHKPTYAPSIIIEDGNEADYGNYFLQLLAGGLLYLAAPVAVIVIAIAGLLYVTSRGDDTQIENAKKTITWAVIGLIVIIFSYTIVRSVIEIVYNTNKPLENQTTGTSGAPSSGNNSSGTTDSTNMEEKN